MVFNACSIKQPIKSNSALIFIKTPTMRFYDMGFINKYKNFTQIQIFTAGKSVLNLKMYKNKICNDTFSCLSYENFNKKYLNSSYNKNFIKNLFNKNGKNIIFRDKKHNILIKVTKINKN